MKVVGGVLVAAVLLAGSSCAREDWIERTLVTVDVTGVWEGSTGPTGQAVGLQFDLNQQGSRVTGVVRGFLPGRGRGEINGTVAGDVFFFRGVYDGGLTGEMTVSGEEMAGYTRLAPAYAQTRLVLRRVSAPSSPRP